MLFGYVYLGYVKSSEKTKQTKQSAIFIEKLKMYFPLLSFCQNGMNISTDEISSFLFLFLFFFLKKICLSIQEKL